MKQQSYLPTRHMLKVAGLLAILPVPDRPGRPAAGGYESDRILHFRPRRHGGFLHRHHRRTLPGAARRAWIAWRDADCRFAYEQFGGGSLRQVAGAACQRDRTAERVLHLYCYPGYGN